MEAHTRFLPFTVSLPALYSRFKLQVFGCLIPALAISPSFLLHRALRLLIPEVCGFGGNLLETGTRLLYRLI